MWRPNTPPHKAPSWPVRNRAFKRRESLSIRFDADIVWAAKPAGKHGRQPVQSGAAVQTCLTMDRLFGMALLLAAAQRRERAPRFRRFAVAQDRQACGGTRSGSTTPRGAMVGRPDGLATPL